MGKAKTAAEKDKRFQLIQLAGIIALSGNLVLAILKLTTGIVTGSLAVLGDGLDTASDVAVACMMLIIGNVISHPSDKEHPWGHGRAETTGTMVLSFIIFFTGSQLGLSAINTLLSGSKVESPGQIAIIVTGISVIGKIILAMSQSALGKKANSSIILANAKNMINDIVISLSVLIGLAGALLFNMPILDPIAALLVSFWIIKNAVQLFMEMNRELMDGNDNKLLYKQLFEAIRSVEGVTNPHRARIRKIASRWDIDLDIEVSGNMSVYDAHEKAEQVSAAIHQAIPDVYDIMVHVEPEDSDHNQIEGYGLSEKDI